MKRLLFKPALSLSELALIYAYTLASQHVGPRVGLGLFVSLVVGLVAVVRYQRREGLWP